MYSPTNNASISWLRSYRSVWITMLIVAALQTCYAAGFIYRSSFIVEGKRYFCLFDDAMISMRYASNWAQGHGLVWNPGERVEGYTNFAWTMIMALLHLCNLSPEHTCLAVQLLGIPILWLCLLGCVLLARSCQLSPLSACLAVILAGTYYNLMFFSLFGMETGLLTCLVTFALVGSVKTIRQRSGRITPMLWFALAILVRLDVLLIILFVFSFIFIFIRKGRLVWIGGLVIVGCVLLAHMLWRYHYYGEWLPNTYYLKATGWPLANRLLPGVMQTARTFSSLGLLVLFALISMFTRFKRYHLLLLGIFGLSAAYQIYIGGDAWSLSRFVIPTSIALFVLAGDGIQRATKMFTRRKTGLVNMAVHGCLVVVCVVVMNITNWDHFLFITAPYTTNGNRMNIRYHLAIQQISDPEASVAVGWAGSIPYYSQRKCIDLLGKCDRYIARLPADPRSSRSGHNKFDFIYSLTTYKPDIVVHALILDEVPYFRMNYLPVIVNIDGQDIAFVVRTDSKKIKGGKLTTWHKANDIVQRAGHEKM